MCSYHYNTEQKTATSKMKCLNAEKRQLKIDDWQRVPQSIEVEMLRHSIRAMVRLNLREVACLVEEETC